ncbi:unnamed protein product [Protopolystoma xenopodis]|uniref:Hyaluronan/mRNA-binding protein domain-containing protein n=1 Tax=Protopolystoma xenopodis TaxID=117903 RepID=A0A3S4ZBN0_9PLAT|nr:unnamed protein product [Protopolystoma xenopodis]
MAQVEHAYQYSVEVRSRFSLLLEDNKSKVKSERPSEPPESHKRKPVPIIVPTPAPPITPATAVDEEPAPESPSEELVEKSPKKTEAVPPFALSRGFRGKMAALPVKKRIDYVSVEGGLEGADLGSTVTIGISIVTQALIKLIKREGFGQGNWGTVQDVLDVTLEPPPEDDASHVVNDENQIPEEKTEEKEEPPKTLTLDEYKAMQRANKPAIALSAKSSRKPNDGKDVFKNMDNLSFIDFTYADRMNRGRGRDGLGRSRGQGFSGGRGESRGFPREERGSRGARATRIRGSREFTRGSVPQPSRSVKVDYDEEFPTLG